MSYIDRWDDMSGLLKLNLQTSAAASLVKLQRNTQHIMLTCHYNLVLLNRNFFMIKLVFKG